LEFPALHPWLGGAIDRDSAVQFDLREAFCLEVRGYRLGSNCDGEGREADEKRGDMKEDAGMYTDVAPPC